MHRAWATKVKVQQLYNNYVCQNDQNYQKVAKAYVKFENFSGITRSNSCIIQIFFHEKLQKT